MSSTDLVVSDAPTCKYDRIMVVGASRGERVDIGCEVEADPPARSYRWKFNNSGETMDVEAVRFANTSNGTVSVLPYTPINELDYGSLSCWASNSVGHQVNPCVFQLVAAGKCFIIHPSKFPRDHTCQRSDFNKIYELYLITNRYR